MSTLQSAELAETMVAAMEAGDLPMILSCLHPDVVVIEPSALPYGGEHRGHDGFAQLLGTITSRLELKINGVSVYEAEPGFAARIEATFTSLASGRALSTTVVEVDEVTDGLVTRIDAYYKDPELVAALFHE